MHYHTHCIANFNNISVLVLSCRSVLLEQEAKITCRESLTESTGILNLWRTQPVFTRADENEVFTMVTVTYIAKCLKIYFKTL